MTGPIVRAPRRILAALLLAVAVIAGLLAMHTVAGAGHLSSHPAAPAGAAVAESDHLTPLGDASAVMGDGCGMGDCASTVHGAALACVLALLATTLIALAVPPGVGGRLPIPLVAEPRRRAHGDVATAPPPSLHVLSISRR